MTGAAPRGRLRRGVVHKVVGGVAPAVVALAAIPALAARLGADRLGLLALVWTTLGYFGLLHLGIGRAVTQSSAGGRGTDPAAQVWTGLAVVGALASVAAVALAALAPWVAGEMLRVPPALQPEAASAFRVLALAVPFVVTAQVLGGALESRFRFGLVSAVAAASSSLSYLGPLAAAYAGGGLVAMVSVLTAVRVAAWFTTLALCLRAIPEMRGSPRLRGHVLGPLLRFGGWSSVSGAMSPLMVYADRFVIGGALSAAAVGFYSLPHEAMLRLGVLSGAVAGVLFPAFASARHEGAAGLRPLLSRGVHSVCLLVFPVSVLLGAFGGDLLRLWLGPAFAGPGAVVLAWLAPALLVNGLAKVASSLLQGVGRPGVVARRHLLEVLPYLVLLFILVRLRGIEGAAIAWLARASGDALLLFLAARPVVGPVGGVMWRGTLLALAAGGASAAGYALPSPGPRAAVALAALGLGAVVLVRWPGAPALPWRRAAAAARAASA
ncbi:MAG: flippase [Gemmatimonadetes bacterium]|nr:flippase [Gemmatimonadota bacterium]